MITEINALGVPPEKGKFYLRSGRIALQISDSILGRVRDVAHWPKLTAEDLAVYVATPARNPQMNRVTLLQLFSHCHSELEAVRELGNLGFMGSYVPPSFNLEPLVASNTEYLLFIIPKKGWNTSWEFQDDKQAGGSRIETESLLNRVLFEVEDNRRTNRELSRKLDKLQEETEELKEALRSRQ
jgi:hypothetical protein